MLESFKVGTIESLLCLFEGSPAVDYKRDSDCNSDTVDVPQVEDQQLLQEWVEEYSDYLYKYTKKYFRNEEVVEDVLQETYLAALQGIRSFKGRSTPKTWLIGILRHKIIDKIRKSSRESENLNSNIEQGKLDKLFNEAEHWTSESGPVPWDSTPEKLLEQKHFLRALQECLSKVPEKSRQIFLLREVEGYSRDEIASYVDLSSTNIGVILYRVRLALQNCIQKNWLNMSIKEQK